MKNGEVKHSNDLVEKDLDGERKLSEMWARMGSPLKVPTLAEIKAKPGYYIGFSGRSKCVSLKGPFADADQAREAHREWMWESKHS